MPWTEAVSPFFFLFMFFLTILPCRLLCFFLLFTTAALFFTVPNIKRNGLKLATRNHGLMAVLLGKLAPFLLIYDE